MKCMAYSKCSINASYYYPYVTDEETETLVRLTSRSQAYSCLEAEQGFEPRQSCSRAHTQPPHNQEKSGPL